MVFFTCNHCGESVKKPSVEKHYNTKCRNAKKSVSCMDCQKDFQDNYVEHTKCISELEKYSGKDYVPKESLNKGAKKQEGWVETVRSVLDSQEYKLNEKTRKAFETLKNYDNVPRKQAKFFNFVTNSVRIPRQIVEDVWSILEKEQEKLKQARQAELAALKKEKSKTTDNDSSVNAENKEKKNKKAETQNGHVEETDKKKRKNTETEDDADNSEKPKKKKAKEQNEDVEEPECDTDGKKQKKKKKNKQQESTEGMEVDEVVEEVNETTDEVGKKNKKKHKIQEEHTNGHAIDENGEDEVPKKKKKKSKSDETVEEDKAVESENIDSTKGKKKKVEKVNGHNASESNGVTEQDETFCWETAFEQIVGKHADGITLEKLKKKLCKKYKTKFDAELTEKQEKGFEKKFNKKLKNNNFLKVEGDLVKPLN